MRIAILSFCALAAASAAASAQTWDFEAPNFITGESTPLLGRAPGVGPFTGITADFTTDQYPLIISPDDPLYHANGLMTGQCLLAQLNTVLVITFSQPVSSVELDFALNGRDVGFMMNWYLPEAGSAGSEPATDVGGGSGFWGGHMSLTGLPGITQIIMSASDSDYNQVQFQIDNVTVPTPGAAAALGLAGAASLRRRRR